VWWVVLVVAALLQAVAVAVSPYAVPIYDGIGFPDEPYRFVVRPAGAQETKDPTIAKGSASVSGDAVGSVVAASAESAPQISIFIPKNKLVVAAGTTEVTVTGTPVQPLPTGRGQYLWSDVYDVTATPGTTIHSGLPQATITMRAASAQRPQPSIAYYADGRWHLLPTYAQGQDIYIAELTTFGKFAVIGKNPLLVTQVQAGDNGGGGGSPVGLIVGIGAGLVIVVLFVLGRIRRARARAAEDDWGEESGDDADEDDESADDESADEADDVGDEEDET